MVAAVNGFCLGGGVGLVGNADCIVASDDAYFGVPEVKQGALGAATHMARLVPQHMMRTLYFTARTIKAADLVQFGSVLEVVPRDQLDDAALKVAGEIAAHDTRVIRAAKECLNGIDPIDVNKSYRFEQGFTMELNLAGVSDELRDEFAGTEKAKRVSKGPRDKQMTIDEVVGELKDGMTIGIGGWGPRRKPMALVRAILRSDLKDLTIVSWGGADVGLLARAGKIRKLVYAFVSPRLRPAGAELPEGPPGGHHPRARRARRGHVPDRSARRRPAAAVPADARRPRLRRAGQPAADQDRHQPVRGDDQREELVAVPALHLDVALVHLNRADKHGNATYLGPDPYFDDLFAMAADRAYVSVEQVVDTAGLTVDTPVQRLLLSRMMVSGVVETPNGAHFTTCTPDYERDEKFQRAYAAAASGSDEDWAAFSARFLEGDEASYQAAVAAFAEEAKA